MHHNWLKQQQQKFIECISAKLISSALELTSLGLFIALACCGNWMKLKNLCSISISNDLTSFILISLYSWVWTLYINSMRRKKPTAKTKTITLWWIINERHGLSVVIPLMMDFYHPFPRTTTAPLASTFCAVLLFRVELLDAQLSVPFCRDIGFSSPSDYFIITIKWSVAIS